MTSLGKTVLITGLTFALTGTLLWVMVGNWQWFAGGTAIFVFSGITAIILSAETKTTGPKPPHNNPTPPPYRPSPQPRPPSQSQPHPRMTDWTTPPLPPSQPTPLPSPTPSPHKAEQTQTFPTDYIPRTPHWEPPSHPPPDQKDDPDPFFNPPPKQ